MSTKTFQVPSQANHAVNVSDDPHRVIATYAEWANTYDQTLSPENYVGPRLSVEEVTRLIPESRRSQVRILDVGAGTGKVGIELIQRGFTQIDGLEPCKEMLDILKATKVYQNTYLEFIGLGSSTVPSDTYDVVIVVGCMGKGHIPVEGIDEMIRMTKPGGYVVNVTREEVLQVPLYKDKLKPHMDKLEREGKWKQDTWKICPKFIGDRRGLVFSYRVL
ncbi:hypothetical protein Pmani_024161 [Petrolisthes manimaculis]|uniref:Methyltransferase domain-containing protein n=1 Tax=Petrolisthes manimaculis TaxID=1843537 RepID=A0AAE1U0B1_9EUCA|nr:hypothetical protein Pmani_024161 [Petrolisthes manimaculis]